MSVASQFFGGSGGNGILIERMILSSGTWNAPQSGKFLVTAIGGGGGAAIASSQSRGGAGAGLAQSVISLTNGESLTIIVGAGGSAGVAGGSTTVTGTGINLIAIGGGAGGSTAVEAVGGTATGGNVMNVQGGNGGSMVFSGGGAVGVYGVKPPTSVQYAGAGVGSAIAYNPAGAAGGSALPNSYNVSTNNGRTLSPAGVGGYSPSGAQAWDISVNGRAGGGGGYTPYAISGNGGYFAGGAGTNGGNGGGSGGLFGGGAGGSNGSIGVGGGGGVIIEWFVSL